MIFTFAYVAIFVSLQCGGMKTTQYVAVNIFSVRLHLSVAEHRYYKHTLPADYQIFKNQLCTKHRIVHVCNKPNTLGSLHLRCSSMVFNSC